MNLVLEVKKKREFSGLPDSIIERALKISKDDVKGARAWLRKYFGVFLTNKVLKGRGVSVLESHISSKGRDYEKVYEKIIGDEEVIFDFGCGANGLSYEKIGSKRYVGIEAAGQLVDIMNDYFQENGFDAEAICEDLMKYDRVLEIVSGESGKKDVWMFNVIDALESFEKDYSKKLIDGIFGIEGVEKIIIGLPVESISGRKKFNVSRVWLTGFLEEKYNIIDDFLAGYERVLIIRKIPK
jgi:hypothetical protein